MRRYQFIRFSTNAEAIAWLEAEAIDVNPDAIDKHVRFGVPGANP